MRLITYLILILMLSPMALAEGVSTETAIENLKREGAQAIDVAVLAGDPQITAIMGKQGIALKLQQCENALSLDSFCKTASFSTCKETPGLKRSAALELINKYASQSSARGSAYLEGSGTLGQKLCIRHRIDLHQGDKFDMADMLDWRLTMRDFLTFAKAEALHQQGLELLTASPRPQLKAGSR